MGARAFVAIFVFALRLASADAVEIFREGARLFAIDSRCKEVEETRQALAEWLGNWKVKNSSCDVTAPPHIGPRGCEIEITGCVPKTVAHLQGRNPLHRGPNCWNLVLVAQRLLPALRHSSSDEFESYLNSPACRPLSRSERAVPGDIGALRSDRQEIHAFVYVSAALAFSKNGIATETPFALQSMEKMLAVYQGQSRNLRYFRCQSMSEILKSRPQAKWPAFLLRTMVAISAVEREVARAALEGFQIASAARSALLRINEDFALAIESEARSNRDYWNKDREAYFILETLYLRFAPLVSQLEMMREDFLAQELARRNFRLRKAMSALEAKPGPP